MQWSCSLGMHRPWMVMFISIQAKQSASPDFGPFSLHCFHAPSYTWNSQGWLWTLLLQSPGEILLHQSQYLRVSCCGDAPPHAPLASRDSVLNVQLTPIRDVSLPYGAAGRLKFIVLKGTLKSFDRRWYRYNADRPTRSKGRVLRI